MGEIIECNHDWLGHLDGASVLPGQIKCAKCRIVVNQDDLKAYRSSEPIETISLSDDAYVELWPNGDISIFDGCEGGEIEEGLVDNLIKILSNWREVKG